MSLPSFEEFVHAVHGHDPFPWQARLTAEVLATGTWPGLIDVPTGLGKTSVLDVAVYVAAARGVGPASPARRRTFFIIDRRVVVDEAFEHASRLCAALGAQSRPSSLESLVDQLVATGSTPDRERPLVVERMRGGLTWSWNWMDRPDRLAIVVGTVDQLGSRFLFRGYGLSPRLAPIDAALCGTDSLIVIDEAHLAEPLRQAVTRTLELDRPTDALPLGGPTVVVMSATPGQRAVARRTLAINEDDERHAVAGRRLTADKRLRLVSPEKRDSVAGTIASGALELRGTGGVVGVVCNTVQRARAVFSRLQDEGVESVLLTGRVRPFDREQNMAEHLPRFKVGRPREAEPLVVVATQTIEVGVNADFDALVAEASPWTSLVQRLGRLNRVGATAEPSPALVVWDGTRSPIYGDAVGRTWAWLSTLSPPVTWSSGLLEALATDGLLVSTKAVRALSSEAAGLDLEVPLPDTPAIGEPQLDAWVRTSPRPVTDPPVDLYLHGFGAEDPDVRLLWRADMTTTMSTDDLLDAIERKPPLAEEMLEVSLRAAHAWLRRASGDEPVMDAPGFQGDGSHPADDADGPEWCGVLISALDEREVVTFPSGASRLRPGDLLVLPSEVGGCDRWGWHPTSRHPVPDVADGVGARHASFTVRLLPAVMTSLLRSPEHEGSIRACKEWAAAALLAVRDDEHAVLAAVVGELLKAADLPTDVEHAAAFEVPAPEPHVVVRLRQRKTPNAAPTGSDGGIVRPNAMSSSASGRAVALAEHQRAVARRANDIARRLGLPDPIVEVLRAAAEWHDVGKLDCRFQSALRGGGDDPFADFGEPLAKSGMDPANRGSFGRAHRLAGLPPGFRHEVGSAQAALQQGEELGLADVDLFVHLVASHHGHARPLFPDVVDEGGSSTHQWLGREFVLEPSQSVDWAQPTRFARLNDRYGRWGLALLEAVVRLSDIECSKEGT